MDTSSWKVDAYEAMDSALRRILDGENLEYTQALRLSPNLVFGESDPMRLLAFANYNAGAAMKRLVIYWKRRV